MNAASSLLSHWLFDPPEKWRPVMGVYYLTYACSFRCPHCSDGSGIPYPQLRSPILPAARVLELFQILRQHCDYLVITGGEPLQHPAFAQVVAEAARFKFRGLILTTNGFAVEPVLPEIAKSVTQLVFSLQTMESAKADQWYGGQKGVHQQVLANLDRATKFSGRKYEIIISTVVTPHNLDDLPAIYEFAKSRGYRLAACPQLVGVKAHAELVGHPKYREFYDFLIREKKRGGLIQGTVDYLEYMRDLRAFRCRPFTMVTVSPVGDVFYPCLELGQVAGNLFTEPNLHRLRQAGRTVHGPQPDCPAQCHSACALGFSRLLANPFSALHEGWLMTRQGLRNFSPRARASSFGSNRAN